MGKQRYTSSHLHNLYEKDLGSLTSLAWYQTRGCGEAQGAEAEDALRGQGWSTVGRVCHRATLSAVTALLEPPARRRGAGPGTHMSPWHPAPSCLCV